TRLDCDSLNTADIPHTTRRLLTATVRPNQDKPQRYSCPDPKSGHGAEIAWGAALLTSRRSEGESGKWRA
ncbi:MAG: hypothetical protein ACRDZO_15675, partial [Egibacteraceae bacterium]